MQNCHADTMSYLSLFLGGMAIGLIFEGLFMAISEKIHHRPICVSHRFSLAKKISLFTLPVWGFFAVLAVSNIHLWEFFLLSAVAGTVVEFALGRFLELAFGTRIWTYKHGQLGKYTSIYSFPYWGAGGLFFLALAKVAGI